MDFEKNEQDRAWYSRMVLSTINQPKTQPWVQLWGALDIVPGIKNFVDSLLNPKLYFLF